MMQDWKGLHILNTRPIGQNKGLSQAIRDMGAIPIECPAIAIEPVENNWIDQLSDLSLIRHAIFISTNAVHYFFDGLEASQCNWPISIRVIAIGRATADALALRKIRVDEVPLSASSEDLLDLESLQHVENQPIVLVKGENGRDLLADTLKMRGAMVLPIAVYRRVVPAISQQYIQSLWHEDAIDVIVFTSEEAMHNLFCLFGKRAHAWLQSKICLVKSERLATAAARFGLKKIVVSTDDNLKI